MAEKRSENPANSYIEATTLEELVAELGIVQAVDQSEEGDSRPQQADMNWPTGDHQGALELPSQPQPPFEQNMADLAIVENQAMEQPNLAPPGQADIEEVFRRVDQYLAVDLGQQMQPPQQDNNVAIVIVEQPQSRGYRFRYQSECNNIEKAGSLTGRTSSTYPTVKIVGFEGRNLTLQAYCCCVRIGTVERHPHRLVGTNCGNGIYTNSVTSQEVSFRNLGIQCTKRREAEAAGFRKSINMNEIRICFALTNGVQTLSVVCSEPIYNERTKHDLNIYRLSTHSGKVNGGEDMIMLCNDVKKDDIEVVFFEENGEWKKRADFGPDGVHRKVAIAFKIPPYKDLKITQAVQVLVHLRKPSNGETSDPRNFQYTPNIDPEGIEQKRRKIAKSKKFGFSQFWQDSAAQGVATANPFGQPGFVPSLAPPKFGPSLAPPGGGPHLAASLWAQNTPGYRPTPVTATSQHHTSGFTPRLASPRQRHTSPHLPTAPSATVTSDTVLPFQQNITAPATATVAESFQGSGATQWQTTNIATSLDTTTTSPMVTSESTIVTNQEVLQQQYDQISQDSITEFPTLQDLENPMSPGVFDFTGID